MKKFLVLSAIVGLAGLGIGIAGRQPDAPATTVEAAADETTTTTTVPALAATGESVAETDLETLEGLDGVAHDAEDGGRFVAGPLD